MNKGVVQMMEKYKLNDIGFASVGAVAFVSLILGMLQLWK
jgi:hypothetical protein